MRIIYSRGMKSGNNRRPCPARYPDGKTTVNAQMIVNHIIMSRFQYPFQASLEPDMRGPEGAVIDFCSELFRVSGPRAFVISFAAHVHPADISRNYAQHCQQPALQPSSVERIYQVQNSNQV